MEDITRGIDRMNVGQFDQHEAATRDGMELDVQMSMMDGQDFADTQQQQTAAAAASQLAILIATNIDPALFVDRCMQSHLESLVRAYDPSATLRYLKSFRRIRMEFTDHQAADEALRNLNNYRIGDSELKLFCANIIRPGGINAANNYSDCDETNCANLKSGHRNTLSLNTANNHLNIPKLTKQFLISPPASPPVGWEPVTENSPCIDVQLISAIANLVPGETHEIHPGNESQPGIFVEVCEEPQFETARKSCARLPRTMSPAFHQAT